MGKLVLVKIKELDEEMYLVSGARSRYLEGEEFVQVKKTPEDKEPKYIKRKSLIFHWK
jgi:hypothetical protein